MATTAPPPSWFPKKAEDPKAEAARIDAMFGPGAYAAMNARQRQQAAQEAMGDALDMPMPEAPTPPDDPGFLPAPKSRAVGGTRGKYESDAGFDFRMNQGIPRGARSGAGGGLDELMLLQEGLPADEARLKSKLIRSQGGRLTRGEDGLAMESAEARRAPRSSTGRDYDPVEERRNLLANAKAAVDIRKREQAVEQAANDKAAIDARRPGTMRGISSKYGTGQAKELGLEAYAKRPEGMVTEGRYVPVKTPIRDLIGIIGREQTERGLPGLDSDQRLQESDAIREAYDRKQKGFLASAGKPFQTMTSQSIPTPNFFKAR